MNLQSFLSLFLALAVAGCASSKAEQRNGVDTNELLRAIDGRATSLRLGGQELQELPAEFDLNPDLKRDEEARAKTGIPFLTKNVSVSVRRRQVGADEVSVRVTPYIDRKRQPGLLVTHEVHDAPDVRVPKAHKEATFTSKRGNEPAVFVTGKDGQQMPDVASDWCLLIAVAARDGIICLSEASRDTVIGNAKSGYRRFRLEGPTNTQGWQLLKPILTK